MARLPISFEANYGQVDPQVRFLTRTDGQTVFFTPSEVVFVLPAVPESPKPIDPNGLPLGLNEPPIQGPEISVVRMRFEGANTNLDISGDGLQEGKSNYFIGNDPVRWQTDVANFSRVLYTDLYPGIDLLFYEGAEHGLEYDFIVAPGADPSTILLAFEGQAETQVDDSGSLVVSAQSGSLTHKSPTAYQTVREGRRDLTSHYRLNDNRVSFAVADFDESIPLVIDPVISYSSYLGGSGIDRGLGITTDLAGNVYIVGETESTNFPLTSPFQFTFGGAGDAFVTKLNPTGSARLYSSYLGGVGFEYGLDIVVNAAGSAHFTGFTQSANFPTVSPFQPIFGGGFAGGPGDAFVTKLDPLGSSLVYSSFLGGPGNDSGNGIAIDLLGNAYIGGWTSSFAFPVISPFQPVRGGNEDAFVAKIDPSGSTKLYSSYLGGADTDSARDIVADSFGNAYLVGTTRSLNFPTTGPFQPTSGGFYDVFVTKVNASGSSKVYSSYLGGSGGDVGIKIAIDASGSVYLTGYTQSTNFLTTAPFQPLHGGGLSDAFVTKVNPSGSGTVYSSYLGGNGNDWGLGIALSPSGEAYISGQTYSTNFPLVDAFQGASGGNVDAFVTKINAAGSAKSYSSYLGGNWDDFSNAIAVDTSGSALIVGETVSTNFPVVNALQPVKGGGARDAFFAKITEPPVAWFTATPTTGRAPLPVVFDASASYDPNGAIVGYAWNYGDADTGTGVNSTHVFARSGTYTVSLTVTDSDGLTATAQQSIVVSNAAPEAAFAANPTAGFSPLSVAFDATASADPDGSIVNYDWDFGDGTTGAGLNPSHVYGRSGSYPVVITVTDDEGATATATTTIQVSNSPPNASFTANPQVGSPPLTVGLDGLGSSDPDGTIVSYDWDYGDGTTGSGAVGSHTYSVAGTYTVGLTVTDDEGATALATKTITIPTGWYFAEGTTRPGFQEYLLFANFGGEATATATYYITNEDGTIAQTQVQSIFIGSNSRRTVNVNDIVGGGRDVSARVNVTNGNPANPSNVLVERSVYFGSLLITGTGQRIDGGHAQLGARSPATDWYFAEGTTRTGFQEFLTFLNPNPAAAVATITYSRHSVDPTSPSSDDQVTVQRTLPPLSRQTVNVADPATAFGANRPYDVSTRVTSDLGIVVERSEYFAAGIGGAGNVDGGHVVAGVQSPSSRWLFAEGTTRAGWQEYLTLQNPSASPVSATINYQQRDEDGLLGAGNTVVKNLPPNSRSTVDVASISEGVGRGRDVSVEVLANAPIVAERPMYFMTRQFDDPIPFSDGHVAFGGTGPAARWTFAEGSTRMRPESSFNSYLTLQNLQGSVTTVTATYALSNLDGSPAGTRVVNYALEPKSRTTLLLNDPSNVGAEMDFSVKIEASNGIVVERPMYFSLDTAFGGGIGGGHDVLGLPG